jgi:hypothetical protein
MQFEAKRRAKTISASPGAYTLQVGNFLDKNMLQKQKAGAFSRFHGT